jgi:multisubunit Na+/H+ antiporter MnhC subunit
MFIGHFGVGFGAKKTAPQISLGTLFIAAQFLDLLWPTLLLLNIERVEIHPELGGNRVLTFTYYPYSHSLVFALFWSLLFGGIYYLLKRDRKVALILGLCVLSHWVLDLVVHFPDLPLYPGNSPLLGFGLWNSLIGTTIAEIIVFVAGLYLYLKNTVAKNRTGKVILWILIGLLILTQVFSTTGAAPGSIKALAWSAEFQWLFVLLAYWADGNRTQKIVRPK